MKILCYCPFELKLFAINTIVIDLPFRNSRRIMRATVVMTSARMVVMAHPSWMGSQSPTNPRAET